MDTTNKLENGQPARPAVIKVRCARGSRRTHRISFEDASRVLMALEKEAGMGAADKEEAFKNLQRFYAEKYGVEEKKLKVRRGAKMALGSWRLCLLIALPLYSGFRRSDIVALKWSDLVYINGQNDLSIQDQVLIVREQKTKKRREIPISKELGMYILKYINVAKPRDLNTYVFKSAVDRSRHLTTTGMTVMIGDAFARFGVYDHEGYVAPHSLRKTYAYYMFKALGANFEALMEVQLLLNHSSVQDTMRYLDIKADNLKSAHNALSFRSEGLRAPTGHRVI